MTSTLPIRLPLDGNTASGSRSSQLPQFEGSAHAKAILFGEHAVVYGAPAIAVPIHELAAEARVDSAAEGVRIESELFSGDASATPARLQPVVTAIHAALAYCGKSDASVRVQILSAIPLLLQGLQALTRLMLRGDGADRRDQHDNDEEEIDPAHGFRPPVSRQRA